MRVRNPDCSPARIDTCHTASTPTGFAKIVGDYFPISTHKTSLAHKHAGDFKEWREQLFNKLL